MQIPDSLSVGPFTYQVEWQERIYSDKGDRCYGASDHEHQTVRLEPCMSEQRKAEVFLHEVLHTLACTFGFELSEDTIRALAPTLLDTMQRNGLDFREA